MFCAHTGMARNGNIKPDSRIDGKKKESHLHGLQLILATVEKVKPTAKFAKMKMPIRLNNKGPISSIIGTSKMMKAALMMTDELNL